MATSGNPLDSGQKHAGMTLAWQPTPWIVLGVNAQVHYPGTDMRLVYELPANEAEKAPAVSS